MSSTPHIFLTGHPACGKTTIIKKLLESIKSQKKCSDVMIKGFYTEECRSQKGDRMGFDIVYYMPDCQEPKRVNLARATERLKKTDPSVGKYLVDIENIDQFAIASLCPGKKENIGGTKDELIIVDEVGKMEMLSPQFIPSVTNLLNETHSTTRKRIILGTIPTPRYGRIIQAVEDIRARSDVVVINVTKSDRDEVVEVLQNSINGLFSGKLDEMSIRDKLTPYLYTRPIGAPSMNGNVKPKPTSISTPSFSPVACGPLVSDNISPKVLLLGETASPLPSDHTYSYCERSMWIVLGKIFQMEYKPIHEIEAASKTEVEQYLNLKKIVLSKGICIWDVLANVHEKGKQKRRRKNAEDIPNNIDEVLKKYSSIQMIGFIGKKAELKYNKLGNPTNLEMRSLPSSSVANSRMTVEEKVNVWKSAILEFIDV